MADIVLPPEPAIIFSVALYGDVDLNRVQELHELIADFRNGPATDVVIDVRGVTFMDSTGLGFMARLYREARARGGSVTLTHAAPQVEKVINVTGMERILQIQHL